MTAMTVNVIDTKFHVIIFPENVKFIVDFFMFNGK